MPPALSSQLSVKTSNSSIVEDPKGHARKKNPISNYPVGAKILPLLVSLFYNIWETEPLWGMLSDKCWYSSLGFSDGKNEGGRYRMSKPNRPKPNLCTHVADRHRLLANAIANCWRQIVCSLLKLQSFVLTQLVHLLRWGSLSTLTL